MTKLKLELYSFYMDIERITKPAIREKFPLQPDKLQALTLTTDYLNSLSPSEIIEYLTVFDALENTDNSCGRALYLTSPAKYITSPKSKEYNLMSKDELILTLLVNYTVLDTFRYTLKFNDGLNFSKSFKPILKLLKKYTIGSLTSRNYPNLFYYANIETMPTPTPINKSKYRAYPIEYFLKVNELTQHVKDETIRVFLVLEYLNKFCYDEILEELQSFGKFKCMINNDYSELDKDFINVALLCVYDIETFNFVFPKNPNEQYIKHNFCNEIDDIIRDLTRYVFERAVYG